MSLFIYTVMPVAATAVAVVMAAASLAIVAVSLRRQEIDEIRRVMSIVDHIDLGEEDSVAPAK